MTLFTFVSGLVLLFLLWLVVPRASFAVALLVIFKLNGAIKISSSSSILDVLSIALLAVAIVVGAILDISEHKAAS